MAIRQEQIVLIATGALLAYLVVPGSADRDTRGGGSAKSPEFEHHLAPDVSRALAKNRSADELERELFAVPRDTRPLPQLVFTSPVLEPLELLRPVPSAGPEPRLFGRFLRQAKVVQEIPGLFVEEEVEEGVDGAGDEFAVEAELDESLMTVEERQARLASYKANYDWVNIGTLHFGHIKNKDRYRLAERTGEAIVFTEVIPASGADRFPGQQFTFERDRVQSFAFAANVENSIELARLPFAGTLTQGQYMNALEFADACVQQQRFETDRALEVAAEIYEKVSGLTKDDPTAQLGLAFCAEAAFNFERAFGIYDALLSGAFSQHPLVLTRLAQLEANFRLTKQAQEHFRLAESYGRTSWLVQWEYGKFLLERGQVAAAVEHLRLAGKFEPTAAEYQSVRAAIRTDFANALVAHGDVQEARDLYTRALQADPTEQRATAGLLNISYMLREALPAAQTAGDTPQTEGAGFDLLIAQGLASLQAGDAAAAKRRLLLAAQSDPLRAFEAWRALSYLAELTGNSAEALYYIDLAEANDPTDVYTLYQRGRILALNDDTAGAMASFSKALDKELELPDALAALGRLEMEEGHHEDAERYFERAVSIDQRLASAHTMRGLNSLHLGRATEARQYFENALALKANDPVASIGRAWCAYSLGDPTESKTLLREFEDSRRHLGEDEFYRVYANEQIARIDDWQEKVVWTDRFERQDLRNGWMEDEGSGPKILMRDGSVVINGTFDKVGRTRIKRFYTSGDFVSLEAKLTIRSDNTVRVGLFVALEQKRGNRDPNTVTSELSISRHAQDKVIQYRSMGRRGEEEPYADSNVMTWADNQTVTLRLERFGDSAKTAFRILVDGVPIEERVPMPTLGATTREIVVGIFAEGESGRTVNLEIDDVEIVKRER